MHECPMCTSRWSSKLAAELCEEECRSEDDARKSGRFYGTDRGRE